MLSTRIFNQQSQKSTSFFIVNKIEKYDTWYSTPLSAEKTIDLNKVQRVHKHFHNIPVKGGQVGTFLADFSEKHQQSAVTTWLTE